MGYIKDLLDETLHWAWTRDESHQPNNLRKVLYFLVLYGGWFILMILVGLALEFGGYPDAASGLWLFGIGFSAFMAAVDMTWEFSKHLLRNQSEGGVIEIGSNRELGPHIRVAADTWIGFIVTVVALLVLLIAYQLVGFLH